jgi:HTH-type transcriptional regulator/antitoxin HigA
MVVDSIDSEIEYERILAEIDKVFDAKPDTLEGDRLEELVTLVEAYEQKHHAIPLPDPVDALLYHLDSRGLTQHALEPYLGNEERVSDVLNRKRSLTIGMIRRLHVGLGISADVLIQPYRRRSRQVSSRKASPPAASIS